MEVEDKDLVGVQLGLDFLLASAWAVFDVKVCGCHLTDLFEAEEESYQGILTTDCFGYGYLWDTDEDDTKEAVIEELRYYARNGASVRLPLLHLKGCKKSEVIISLGEGRIRECSWCCRHFLSEPGDHCESCRDQGRDTFYCDNTCKSKASQIHRHHC